MDPGPAIRNEEVYIKRVDELEGENKHLQARARARQPGPGSAWPLLAPPRPPRRPGPTSRAVPPRPRSNTSADWSRF